MTLSQLLGWKAHALGDRNSGTSGKRATTALHSTYWPCSTLNRLRLTASPCLTAWCGYFGMSPDISPATGQSNQAFRGLTMQGVAGQLRSFLGRTVIDGTGLTGYYDGDFEFTTEIALPPPPPGVPDPYADRVFPSIFSVLPQQLGLRLEAERGPVDVIVIDHAEQPTEN